MSLLKPRRSFTLIELLVVVAILATLTGLVVGRVDWAQDSSQAAASAAGAAQVQNNLQVYKTQYRSWPNGYDSLIDQNSGTPRVYQPVYGEVAPSAYLTWLQADTTFTASTPPATDNPIYSLTKLGINEVYDHDASSASPNGSASIQRTFSAFDSSANLVFATVRLTTSSGDPTHLAEQLYPLSRYPTGIPAGVKLIALGIGSNCTAVGRTMANAPTSAATDAGDYYSRYIALFEVYPDGASAKLKAIVDSTGALVDDQLQNYSQSSPE